MSEDGQTLRERLLESPDLFDPAMAVTVASLTEDADGDDLFVSRATNRHVGAALAPATMRDGTRRIDAHYLGLVGPTAALPQFYTRQAILEGRRRNDAYMDFLEIFASRLRSLFIACDRKYRLVPQLQAFGLGPQNKVVAALFALCGVARGEGTARELDDAWILYFSGHFSNQRRTAVHLERMLEDFLRLDVVVQQFRERRLPISEDEQSRLDRARPTTCILGASAVAGSIYFDRRSAIRIRIGPLAYAEYLALMPDRRRFRELVELIRLYLGPSISFDIVLVLRREDIPQLQLNGSSPVGRLGWDSWALAQEAAEDSDQTVFDPDLM